MWPAKDQNIPQHMIAVRAFENYGKLNPISILISLHRSGSSKQLGRKERGLGGVPDDAVALYLWVLRFVSFCSLTVTHIGSQLPGLLVVVVP